jgi:hypothetical protein
MPRAKGSKNKVTLDRIKLKQQELLKLNEDYEKQLKGIKNTQPEPTEPTPKQEELPKTETNISDNQTYKDYNLTDPAKTEKIEIKEKEVRPKPKKEKIPVETKKVSKYLFE